MHSESGPLTGYKNRPLGITKPGGMMEDISAKADLPQHAQIIVSGLRH